jgi:hypothetical protein
LAAVSFEHADEARAALRAIVADPAHGTDALSSPQVMSNLLQDLLPDAPRESGLLVAAASAGLPQVLREHVAQGLTTQTAIGLAASSLAARTAFTSAACAWAATEIAVALGLLSPDTTMVPVPDEVGSPGPDVSAAPSGPSAVPQQPPAVAGQPGAAAHQPSAVPHQPPAVPHQPPAVPHQPPAGQMIVAPTVGQQLAPTDRMVAAAPGGPPRRRLGASALIGASIIAAGAVVATAIVLGARPGSTGSTPPRSGSPGGGGTHGPPAPGYRDVATLDPGTPGSMTQVAWTPDSSIVATSDKDGSTYLWDPATAKMHGPPLTVPGAGKAFAMAISPDGTTLAAGYSNGSTYLWDIATGQPIGTLVDPSPAAGRQVDSVAFSPDGHTLVSADGNGHAYVWQIPPTRQSPTPVRTLTDPAGAGMWSAVFSSGGTLATGDYSGNIYLWNLGSGGYRGPLAVPGGIPVTALAFSQDGSVLVAGSGSLSAGSGSVYLFSTASLAGQDIANPGPVWAMSFNGSTLAAADGNGQTYLWRISEARLTATPAGVLPDPNSGIQGVGAVDFSPNGRWLVTGDTNGRAYVWRLG